MKSASQRRALVAAFLATALAGCSHNCFNRGEGCSSSSSSAAALVAVPTSGKVTDGYVANATVTLDVNNDRICEAGEPTTPADANGNFTFSTAVITQYPGAHMVCASGGTDLSTGLPLVGTLMAPPGSTQITPLTSLVMANINAANPPQAGVASPVSSTQASSAASAVAISLGLSGTNLLTADPVALASTNPALLQSTAAIQALLVQIASTIQAAGGGGTAVAGSPTTNTLFANALAGLSNALSSASGPINGPAALGSLAGPALASAATAAKSDTLLAGVNLGNLNPASLAAFAGPSLAALTNAVGAASPTELGTAGAGNPAANAQANVSIANTVGLLASTILSVSPVVSSTELATLATSALPAPNASGVITPPSGSADQTLLSLISAIPGVNASNLPSASQLASAGGLNNVTHVVEADVNCDLSGGIPQVSCGAQAQIVFQPANAAVQADVETTAFNNVVLRLSSPTGFPVGGGAGTTASSTTASASGTLNIAVTADADIRTLNISVPITLTENVDATGVASLSGQVTGSMVVKGLTRQGLAETATLTTAASQGIVSFDSASNAVALNFTTLMTTLGTATSQASGSSPFSILQGSMANGSFTVVVSTAAPATSSGGLFGPPPTPAPILNLTTFPNPSPAVSGSFTLQINHPNPVATSSSLSGTVTGLPGATVMVFAAGLNPGDKPVQIASTTADSKGNFGISAFSPIPASGQVVYLVAQGGTGISLMTVVGNYANGNFPGYVIVNALTTVASTSQLQNYLTEVACSGITGVAAGSTGLCPSLPGALSLAARAPTVVALVDVGSGSAAETLSGAATTSPLYTTWTKLNLEGDVLANCVKSGVTTSTACTGLFGATTVSSVVPTDTTQAALALARSATQSGVVSALFALSAQLPTPLLYSPIPAAAPASLTVGGSAFFYTNSGTVYAYNPGTGGLSATGGTFPFSFATPLTLANNGRYAYQLNARQASPTLAVYAIDPATGAAVATGTPSVVDAGGCQYCLSLSPSGKFLYVVTQSGRLTLYPIDSSTGQPAKGQALPGSNFGGGFTLLPSGQFGYSGTTAYSVNTNTGALAATGALVAQPIGFYAITSNSRFGFIASGPTPNGNPNPFPGQINSYSIDGGTGAVTEVSSQPTGVNPASGGVGVSPTSQFIYVPNLYDNTVSEYSINVQSGALTTVGTIPSGKQPQSIFVSPDGGYAYVDNYADNTVSVYSINAVTGVLTTVGAPLSSLLISFASP